MDRRGAAVYGVDAAECIGGISMRLIDADKLLRSIPNDLPYKASVRRVLMQAETVDAVPVVRTETCTAVFVHTETHKGGDNNA